MPLEPADHARRHRPSPRSRAHRAPTVLENQRPAHQQGPRREERVRALELVPQVLEVARQHARDEEQQAPLDEARTRFAHAQRDKRECAAEEDDIGEDGYYTGQGRDADSEQQRDADQRPTVARGGESSSPRRDPEEDQRAAGRDRDGQERARFDDVVLMPPPRFVEREREGRRAREQQYGRSQHRLQALVRPALGQRTQPLEHGGDCDADEREVRDPPTLAISTLVVEPDSHVPAHPIDPGA